MEVIRVIFILFFHTILYTSTFFFQDKLDELISDILQHLPDIHLFKSLLCF